MDAPRRAQRHGSADRTSPCSSEQVFQPASSKLGIKDRMTASLTELFSDLRRYRELAVHAKDTCRRQAALVRFATADQVSNLVDVLLKTAEAGVQEQTPQQEHQLDDDLLAALAENLWRHREADSKPSWAGELDRTTIDKTGRLYRRLDRAGTARYRWLRLLAAERTPAALARFAELIVDEPPADDDEVVLCFAPLLRPGRYDPGVLFPRLLEALKYPHVAAVALDLCNYLARCGLVGSHPATARVKQLADLLGRLVAELQRLEENPVKWTGTPAERSARMGQSVSLFVALCDALALIGDPRVVGKLYQATKVAHRGLRTEAGAALARLGEAAGADVLVEMLAEPVVRNRALGYLEEVGRQDRIPDEYRSPVARAEGDLAFWLAQPTQLGIAPTSITLVDSQRIKWPGYVEPVDCYLFQYECGWSQEKLDGVAIAGPVTYTLSADLADLPPDDIYAAFAGWHAEHEEMYEIDADQLSDAQRETAEQMLDAARGQGYQDVELALLGYFFGEPEAVATARRGQVSGVVVIDRQRAHWYPQGTTRRPLGPTEAYYIYKGRRILGTFNP